MDENHTGLVLTLFVAGMIALLLVLSLTGPGTWIGGVGLAWTLMAPVVLLAAAIYLALATERRRAAGRDGP